MRFTAGCRQLRLVGHHHAVLPSLVSPLSRCLLLYPSFKSPALLLRACFLVPLAQLFSSCSFESLLDLLLNSSQASSGPVGSPAAPQPDSLDS